MKTLAFKLVPAWTVFLAGTMTSLSAHAYCRTTTCDPNVSCSDRPNDCCKVVASCDQNGIPISWPNSCVSFNIQEDGSELREISAEQLSDIVDDAFDKWLEADCEGDAMSLAVENRGFAACGTPEYNEGIRDKNANVWMFRDSGDLSGNEPSGGPIDSRTLAITTLSIDIDTGDIYGVDVELNSALADFTTSDEDVGIDLESIVTHEAGHFLGLDHSTAIPAAVMRASYSPGDVTPRTLTPDDVAGICSIYPKNRSIEENTCEPRGEYSTECHEDGCGCRIVGGPSAPSRLGVWFALLAAGAFITRRARRV